MNIQEFIANLKKIQQEILYFLENESDEEESYQNLVDLLNNQNFGSNYHYLKSFLYLLVKIANNHHRYPNFFEFLEKIIQLLKSDIKKLFSNSEIFKIFKNNKKFLLFLIEEGIIKVDKIFLSEIMKSKYIKAYYKEYFFPEIIQIIDISTNQDCKNECINNENEKNDFLNMIHKIFEKDIKINDFSDNKSLSKFLLNNILHEDNLEYFKIKRKNGNNDDFISQLIQKDSIEEFIIYINKNDYSIENEIKPTIFETNNFLLKNKNIQLIEYAAFYGSVQIFKYLYKNGVELTSSLWLYAIHGDNAEIILILEENHVNPPNNSYENCIKESLKCHHNHIVNYIQNNLINIDINEIDFDKKFNENVFSYSFHYYNFYLIQEESIINNIFSFYYACEYDYFIIVMQFLKEKIIDLNKTIIQILLCF